MDPGPVADRERCAWGNSAPEYVAYHDEEWGTPLHGDDALFERVCLEAFQSGLSWITVLRKRPAFRTAFAGFSIDAVAAFTADDEARLVTDAGIVRNRAKIAAAVRNARAAQQVPEGLDALLWSFAPTAPRPRPATLADVPATSPESAAMARELKRRGFAFVGPTTAYALMQATGMVDDHVATCFRATRAGAAVGSPTGIRDHLWRSSCRDEATPQPHRLRVVGEGGTHGGHEAAHG